MNFWNLREDGDSLEQEMGAVICSNFPNYEIFWLRHVLPLTDRPRSIHLRIGIPKILADVASANYKVFQYLAYCHETLTRGDAIYGHRELKEFYECLYNSTQGLNLFLRTTNKVISRYHGFSIGKSKSSRWGNRLARYGDVQLATDSKEISNEIGMYRGPLAHDHEFVRVDNLIPRRDVVKKYMDWNQTALLRDSPDRSNLKIRDFVDPKQVGNRDLEALEKVLNRIWEIVIKEYLEFESSEDYRKDRGAVPNRPVGIYSRAVLRTSTDTSGSIDFIKSGFVSKI